MAGFMDKFKNIIYGEDYEDEYDYEEEDIDTYSEPIRKESTAPAYNSYASSTSSKIASFSSYPRSVNNSKVVNINTNIQMEIIIASPKNIEEAAEVCLELKSRKTAVINLENVDFETSQRISDFLCGASYALEGDIQLIADKIMIIGPVNVEITNELKDEINKASKLKFPNSGSR